LIFIKTVSTTPDHVVPSCRLGLSTLGIF